MRSISFSTTEWEQLPDSGLQHWLYPAATDAWLRRFAQGCRSKRQFLILLVASLTTFVVQTLNYSLDRGFFSCKGAVEFSGFSRSINFSDNHSLIPPRSNVTTEVTGIMTMSNHEQDAWCLPRQERRFRGMQGPGLNRLVIRAPYLLCVYQSSLMAFCFLSRDDIRAISRLPAKY